MLVDYHIHTSFSDDSEELMENQVKIAIEKGVDEICFTDHVDYGVKRDHDDPRGIIAKELTLVDGSKLIAMQSNVDYPNYFKEIEKLQSKYQNQIVIKKGLELGVQTVTLEDYRQLDAKYGKELDFALLSIHQIDNKEFWTQEFQEGKTQQQYNELYYKEMYNVIKNYKNYCCLSHLDMLIRYDLQGVYPFEKVEDLIAEVLKLAIKDGKDIEINTSSWHYKLNDTTPSRAILRLYKDLGGKIITMGSDAHTCKYLADQMKEAQKILKEEIGFEYLCTFTKRQPQFIKL